MAAEHALTRTDDALNATWVGGTKTLASLRQHPEPWLYRVAGRCSYPVSDPVQSVLRVQVPSLGHVGLANNNDTV